MSYSSCILTPASYHLPSEMPGKVWCHVKAKNGDGWDTGKWGWMAENGRSEWEGGEP